MRNLFHSKQGGDKRLKGKLLATAFFENSSRTCYSTQAAMIRLGGNVLTFDSSTSSVKKGESLEDTVTCLSCYCDLIVLRHPEKGAAFRAYQATKKPLVNAGDGIGEHPTQALLDAYTIYRNFGTIENKVITIVGDLKNGRTVHSLSKLLAIYNCEIHFVSPSQLRMPVYVIEKMKQIGCCQVFEEESFEHLISKTDVLYLTRVQKERFESVSEYEALKNSYCVTPTLLKRAKNDMILMHPLPRVCEISQECDADPRAKYVQQMENGMIVRMALLALIFGATG